MSDLNEDTDFASLISLGWSFQYLEALTKKAQSPKSCAETVEQPGELYLRISDCV